MQYYLAHSIKLPHGFMMEPIWKYENESSEFKSCGLSNLKPKTMLWLYLGVPGPIP